ncbi:sigma-70 family RNA polymerase sigma factor [uncultured Chitinophaga sp.]|jgi:RNA polymerase sigma factor, sigma-70 family|uniref:RNA polymerase sigma factor n=1 Tax=uncultured Chitinophaga sp. TaxID=339340 RepID=UPI002608F97D|nr:sigma-70 family RNA polymerase sigma factor [uncultured Chitinophaga sp.]
MNTNDQLLLNRLQNGDDTAFAQLFELYRRWLVYVALTMLDDETEAHDTVQDFFMDCWERKLFTSVNVSLKSFLHCSIRNRCLNKLRNEALRKKKLKKLLVGEETSAGYEEQHDELWDQLSLVLPKVPPMSAKVFQLTYVSGFTRKEVAELMGISPSTVKHQLARALRILRGLLERVKLYT